jgi:hypothetical protein
LVRSSAGRISDLVAKGQNLKNGFHRSRMENAAFPAAFSELDSQTRLLTEVPSAILAAEPGAGGADKTVAAGIGFAADRGGGDTGRRADRAADDTDRAIARPEAAVVVEAVVAAPPRAIPIGLIAIDLTLVAAAIVGASRSFVLAIGVLDRTARSSRDYRSLPAPWRGLRERTQGPPRRREFRILSWVVDSDSIAEGPMLSVRANGSFRCGPFRGSQTAVMPKTGRARPFDFGCAIFRQM